MVKSDAYYHESGQKAESARQDWEAAIYKVENDDRPARNRARVEEGWSGAVLYMYIVSQNVSTSVFHTI